LVKNHTADPFIVSAKNKLDVENAKIAEVQALKVKKEKDAEIAKKNALMKAKQDADHADFLKTQADHLKHQAAKAQAIKAAAAAKANNATKAKQQTK